MRKESKSSRAAWTKFVTGQPEKKASKYGNEKTEDGYDSKREARVAKDLWSLQRAGNIKNLQEQVPVVLVKGRDGVRSITWVADFVYEDPDGTKHHLDAKGFPTNTYKLKKRLAYLLKGISIEEV